ncbi:hypothetical protein L1987_73297 [Smallanthus sonchifolius]|uniref:Uncharacterized protein n=1 Tax=Smallanthus sonchifolius TaxID=185202 RepID=A0ACB9A081_9ASTR|nr:hypothetical protein L1987_73297 [Smallanthus sonchifolius]
MDPSFPRGVWPPNLRDLTIGKLKKPISKWGPQNFPTSLVTLRLYGGEDGVSSCRQFSDLFPSSLTYLEITGFEKLESVSEGIQHLTSLKELDFYGCHNLKKLSYLQHLQHLRFDECPNMMELPEELLPSLLSLRIWYNCPKLKERCSERGHMIALISERVMVVFSKRKIMQAPKFQSGTKKEKCNMCHNQL